MQGRRTAAVLASLESLESLLQVSEIVGGTPKIPKSVTPTAIQPVGSTAPVSLCVGRL